MIEIRNAKTIGGQIVSYTVPSKQHLVIDAKNLLLFPAGIDPHVHFRTPGHAHKEDWKTASQAAIYGGITTVFDMPNNTPPCSTRERLHAKKAEIDQQLREINIPLRYYLYFGVQRDKLSEIPKVKDEVIGLKVFMGSSTGDLLIDDQETLSEIFKLASKHDLVVAVHAEDEKMLQERKKNFSSHTDPSAHSLIRSPEAAAAAVDTAIELARKHKTKLYILHVSTEGELTLIRKAKKEGLSVYAEATPHHLFLDESAYKHLGNKALVNPPLRSKKDQEALWRGIHDQTIDTVGSDHAPHTLEEKNQPFGKAPSGIPGVELILPLLFQAYHEKKLNLPQIASLTSTRIQEIFSLPPNDDVLLVDLEMEKKVGEDHLKTKVRWSPYTGKTLKGWPVYTIVRGEIFHLT